MNHWLVKQEPEDYAFSQFVKDRRTDWTGVRNFQARNFLRAMATGDAVLYYHSGGEKAVVGEATVSRAAFPDPTAGPHEQKGAWVAVELRAGKAFVCAVSLAEMKADPTLRDLLLIKQSRLSVLPVTPTQYARILELAAQPDRTDQ